MTKLRLASYNVHKAVGLDRRRDPARILRVLLEVDADIVALQEVDKRLGSRPTALPRFLIRQETDYTVVDLAENDVSLGWHGNAILVRKGLSVSDLRHVDLPGLEPRGAVMARIEGLTVVGTHLALLRYWRQRQMLAIINHLDGEFSKSAILGDFNEWSTTQGFEPLMHDFTVLRPGRSFHAIRPVGELDRIAHGRKVSIRDHGVHNTALARIASDHLPVWADVKFDG